MDETGPSVSKSAQASIGLRRGRLIKLTNTAGSAFELQIIGYEFPQKTVDWDDAKWQQIERELGKASLPDDVDDSYDLNWPNVRISAAMNGRTWGMSYPCLQTTEVIKLADWLEAVRLNQQSAIMECGFIEPLLAFERTQNASNDGAIRVYFQSEARPPWSPGLAGRKDIWIDFPLSDIDLEAAIASLRAQYAAFPFRGPK